jgi:hypothetical protein
MPKISSLEEMEKIVKNNNRLSWDGWTVLYTYPNPVGWRDAKGVLVKGKWHTQQRFEINETGWEIPKNLVR